MGLVIEALMALALVVGVIWLLSLRHSVSQDQAEAQTRAAEAREAKAREAREARLYRKGEKLRCLGCNTTFLGPLPDTGCPHCHISALVVTDRDYRQGREAAPQTVSRKKDE